MPFDGQRWKADAQLSRCSPATRGVWIDWLVSMWESNGSGELVGSVSELATLGRCKDDDVEATIKDLTRTNAADIFSAQDFTYRIVNRKMKRDYERRNGNTARQAKYREAATNVELTESQDADFERFWAAFPNGRKRAKGIARGAFGKALGKVEAETIIAAAIEYAASEIGMSKWVKMPSTWLNADGWADDRAAWQDRDLTRSFASITATQFRALYDAGKFSADYPQRDKTNPKRVYGKLRDNRQVECTNYPLPRTQQPESEETTPVDENICLNG